jgi:hypothetical protein
MPDFFSNELTQSIPWFGLTHILLLLGFFTTLVLLWIFGPKLGHSKYEKYIRYFLVALTILFEWRVFESRMLEGSLFRMPLCAVALYGLTFAIAFNKEKVYKIAYFYAFGTILTYLFFDTVWGLDRWSGWTYFGAHAAIGWFAVYGYRVLGYNLTLKDLHKSMTYLAIYAFISGYAFLRFGGADELFLFHAPADFMNFLIDIHPIVYLIVFIFLAALLMFAMYLPIYLSEKKKNV